MDYELLRSKLPPTDQRALDDLWAQTAGNTQPLYLSIAGAFSTGKTTLLNSLLGENLLPVALEETTTLPTFVEFSETRRYELVAANEVIEIKPKKFATVIRQPPAESIFLMVGLPIDWIRGITIIDLPGLGSMNGRNREYSSEYLRQSDAVIYLISSLGATKDDLTNLSLLRTHGKKVFVGVAKWDVVLEAANLRENLPDLASLAEMIHYETGLKVSLTPLNRLGLGQEAVLDFIQKVKTERQTVLMERFLAEARPVIQRFIDHCNEAIHILGSNSEDQLRENHNVLVAEKQILNEMRRAAKLQYVEETRTLFKQWDKNCEELTVQLRDKLHQAGKQWLDKNGEEAYLNQGEAALKEMLAQAALFGQSLSNAP